MNIRKNLIGELRIIKDLDIKPNFSALQREYGVDRHIIKKYFDNDGIPIRQHRSITSKWDSYYDEIDELLSHSHITYKAVWFYLMHKYGEDSLPGNYSAMRNYLYRKGRRMHTQVKAYVLYETPPGK